MSVFSLPLTLHCIETTGAHDVLSLQVQSLFRHLTGDAFDEYSARVCFTGHALKCLRSDAGGSPRERGPSLHATHSYPERQDDPNAACDRPWSLSPTPRKDGRVRRQRCHVIRRRACAHTSSTPRTPGTRRRCSPTVCVPAPSTACAHPSTPVPPRSHISTALHLSRLSAIPRASHRQRSPIATSIAVTPGAASGQHAPHAHRNVQLQVALPAPGDSRNAPQCRNNPCCRPRPHRPFLRHAPSTASASEDAIALANPDVFTYYLAFFPRSHYP
ncbi:hypothetical protein B0H13DRAFT_2325139 [Mycena leptocephala]|nr:hypothetical protein B0H13DRAFT_2325139 [Mycena leptocephala]